MLRDDVQVPAKALAAGRAAAEADAVLEQLATGVLGELDLLGDADASSASSAAFADARDRLDHLRGPAARWSVLVGDRITDLNSDVAHRFRGALRTTTRTIEDEIELLSTPDEWTELAGRLQTMVTEAVATAFASVEQGAVAIQEDVAALLAEDTLDLPPLPERDAVTDPRSLWTPKDIDPVTGRLSSTLTGLRGAQSGILLFGMMSSFLPGGIAAFIALSPVTLGIGAAFAGVQLLDAHKRKVQQRRTAARANLRQFLDDVQFEVGDELGQALRDVQRGIRDDVTQRIGELQRTYADLCRQAQEAARASEDDRGQRREELRGQLARLDAARRVVGGGGRLMRSTVDAVRELCDSTAARLAGHDLAVEVAEIRARLDGPMRVAVAGRVKAGKSTLLNALVGARVAATDAGECTQIVTWYQDGLGYEVVAHLRDGTPEPLGFRRHEGALEVQLGGHDPAEVERIDVRWPSSSLRELTLIDTPGLASLHDETSLRSREFLAFGESRPSDADAVIYLMSHLHRRDAEFLGAFMDRTVVAASPVNAVVVLSRADEIGAGRRDAMASSARIAARYQQLDELRSLCSAVVPVAGLLAETAQSLREDEVASLRLLAATDDAELERMLLSVATFLDPGASDLTVESRFELLDRLGLFGVRLAVDRLRAGPASATELARDLLAASGFDGLRAVLVGHFLPRAQVLKARSALVALRAVAQRLGPDGRALAGDLERCEAASLDFALLRAAHLVRTGDAELTDTEASAFDRLSRAEGTVAARLGLDDAATVDERRAAAVAEVERWRARRAAPLAEPALVEVRETAARACEALYQEVGQGES